MKIKCEFCGSMMNDTVESCPNCGAPNPNVRRSSGDQPLTIEQLKQWYESKGLPPYSVTRFFIGENYTEPKAFGIYYEEETGNYIVYKNKASGDFRLLEALPYVISLLGASTRSAEFMQPPERVWKSNAVSGTLPALEVFVVSSQCRSARSQE